MRQFKRVSVNSAGYALDSNDHFQISILDFSRMGVAFTCAHSFSLNTFVSIVYQNENNQLIQMKIYVKNISVKTSSAFRVGAQFVAVESRD